MSFYDLNIEAAKEVKISSKLYNLEQLKETKLLGYLPKTFAKIINNELVPVKINESDYIVKFEVEGLESHSANEHFFLWLAKKSGVNCSKNKLLPHNDNFLFLSERFDKEKQIIHLADMFSKEDRRNISLEKTLTLVNNFDMSSEEKVNIQKEILKQFLFSNTIGNYDLHAYNIAFLYDDGNLELAPAYDIVCTQIFDESTRSAIKVLDKKSDVEPLDIIEVFNTYSALSTEEISKISKDIHEGISNNLNQIKNSYIDKEDIEFAFDYISKRNMTLDSLKRTPEEIQEQFLNDNPELENNYEENLALLEKEAKKQEKNQGASLKM